MLQALNLAQLILYIPLLALLGQGLLYVLAGAKRDSNFFYQLLQLVSRPFTWVVRKLTPAKVADRHVPFATFCLVLLAYVVVTMEKLTLCLQMGGVQACR